MVMTRTVNEIKSNHQHWMQKLTSQLPSLKGLDYWLRSFSQYLIHFPPRMGLLFAFLEDAGLLHCFSQDLAARNVLVNESMICKVADFGMSRELQKEEETYNTTVCRSHFHPIDFQVVNPWRLSFSRDSYTKALSRIQSSTLPPKAHWGSPAKICTCSLPFFIAYVNFRTLKILCFSRGAPWFSLIMWRHTKINDS